MPQFLTWGLKAFTLVFAAAGLRYGGRPFFANAPSARERQWKHWRGHRLAACRDFVRLHESLAALALYSRPESTGKCG